MHETLFSLKGKNRSTPKFPRKDRETIKSIVAALTIKRISDNDIIKVIFDQTGKTITDRYLSTIRQQIKRESYHWYKRANELSLDKEKTSYSDSIDALRLACKMYKMN